MLTRSQLAALQRALHREQVLSVYIDGSATDPAVQRAWRVQLDNALDDVDRWLAGSPRSEVAAFESCVAALDQELASVDPSVGATGWAGFITANGIQSAGPLPTPVPTLVVWSNGACIAPYVRALRETRPVVVVVADARSSTIHRYHLGRCERVETIRSHHPIERPLHMGGPARVGFHTGTRGAAGQDAAQRALLHGRDRMLAETAARVNELADGDAWIVVGGIKRVVAHLFELLAPGAPHRVLALPSFDVHASEAVIAEAARTGASALRDARDARRVAELAEAAAGGGLGVTGAEGTQHALEQSCVRELYLTARYRENHAARAESAVRAALEQDAEVEEVSGAAAEALDREGGIAAGLRFRPAPIELTV